MAQPRSQAWNLVAILFIALTLAGCGAPKPAPEAPSLDPLPDPIHEERSIMVEVVPIVVPPIGPCPPTAACADYPFTLPRRALVDADVTWTNAVGAMTLELMREGELLATDQEGAAEGTRRVGLTLEADAGDYVLRVRPTDMVNDRYVLDVTFQEIVEFAGKPVDTRSSAEAHAAIATRMSGVACKTPQVDPTTTSDNLVQLTQLNRTEGQQGELDARDGWLVVTVLQGGFDLVDVSDPLAPFERGRYLPDSGASFDAKWMPDGQTIVVGQTTKVELVDVSSLVSGEPGGDFVVLDSWDYESAGPTDRPNDMHMLTPARIGGTDWVFVATQGNAGVAVLKLDNETHTLSLAGRIGNDAFSGGIDGPHDTSFTMDEFTGRPFLYVANANEGWRVFDVSDPMGPVELANVPHPYAYNFVHNVVAQKVDGRRLVAVSEEGFGNVVTVYDATDWSQPRVIGLWAMLERDPLASTHNIQIVDGLLYLAHYRAGAFVFDLRDLGSTPTSMEPIAHFEPPFPTGLPVPGYGAYFNNIWDFIVHRGVLYASDIDAGTYVLGFGCLTPGDEAASSHN